MTEENVSNNENVAEIKKVNKPKRNFRRNYVKKDKEEVKEGTQKSRAPRKSREEKNQTENSEIVKKTRTRKNTNKVNNNINIM